MLKGLDGHLAVVLVPLARQVASQARIAILAETANRHDGRKAHLDVGVLEPLADYLEVILGVALLAQELVREEPDLDRPSRQNVVEHCGASQGSPCAEPREP